MSQDRDLLAEHPHRRLNILTGEWILVSPHRAKRPWQGKVERLPAEVRPAYDPGCYLCPGNTRAGGAQNPAYTSTFVFTNDFGALLPETGAGEFNVDGLLQARGESGVCRVICFSPRHDLSLPEMTTAAVRDVVEVWCEEYRALGSDPAINYVQIFENKGELMGCSNPHPHCQIWAQRSVPAEPEKELLQCSTYARANHGCLLCDYLAAERNAGERIICSNEHFAVLVPFWAVWPFETMIVAARHRGNLTELGAEEREAFAETIHRLTIRYDNLFEVPFPYSSGIHQSPTDGIAHPESHLHMHFYPPLLRSATVKKFMVGYEMLANPQRDITAERSAERLRSLADVHYRRDDPAKNTH